MVSVVDPHVPICTRHVKLHTISTPKALFVGRGYSTPIMQNDESTQVDQPCDAASSYSTA